MFEILSSETVFLLFWYNCGIVGSLSELLTCCAYFWNHKVVCITFLEFTFCRYIKDYYIQVVSRCCLAKRAHFTKIQFGLLLSMPLTGT